MKEYNARFYSPGLGKFIQPDTIVPDPGSAMGFNRYAYVNNSPINYNDPTGHFVNILVGALVGAVFGFASYAINASVSGQTFDAGDAFQASGVGALAGGLIGSGVGMLAAGSVGAVSAVAGTASVTQVAAVTIGVGAGIGSSGAAYVAGNLATGSEYDSTDFAISTSVGAATGAAGPMYGTTRIASGLINAGASAVEYELSHYNKYGEFDFDMDTLEYGAWGGILGAISPNTPLDEIDIKPRSDMEWFENIRSFSETSLPSLNIYCYE